MRKIDDGPDGLNDNAFDRAWARAIREDAARRAAQLPAKVRQATHAIPTTDLDAHLDRFAPVFDAINAGFASTGSRKP